jgi:ferredoxin--NADP+ reductase
VGRFTLDHSVGADDPRLKVFVAAGTGIAPFVSMVRAARRASGHAALGRMAVLHGASRPHELAYRAELEECARTSGLRYLPTVSRPAEHPEWTGAQGRVEAFFDAQHVAHLETTLGLPAGGLTPDHAVVYVCGFRGTIAETTRRLLRRGFVPEDRRLRRVLGLPDKAKPSLFFEQYDLEPVFDPGDQALIEELRRDVFGR